MTIRQLLDMPIGERTGGGFVLTIAHTHKLDKYSVDKGIAKWTPSDGYMHEVTLTDETGDMLADFVMERYNPFVRRQEVKIIVCEIQPSANASGKKLLVHEWEKITCTVDELPEMEQRYPLRQNGPNWEAIGRGKVKCRIFCSTVEKEGLDAAIAQIGKMGRPADWVMSPEDKYNG